MTAGELRSFYERPLDDVLADPDRPRAHQSLLERLEEGAVRAASPDGDGGWTVHAWVKRAILAGFRGSPLQAVEGWGTAMYDRAAFPPRAFRREEGVRLVPGGTAVRRGARVAAGVVIMPPAYVNVGAWVDEGTLVDSHALVGSCAQVGRRVHLSAGAQLGGVLEPAGARPVIVEDEAFVGGLAGVFEGVRVRERAVLAAGVLLTGSTPVYDCVRQAVHRGEVPAGAVVVPGARVLDGDFARRHGVSVAAAVVVKYRDGKTDAATALEEALR